MAKKTNKTKPLDTTAPSNVDLIIARFGTKKSLAEEIVRLTDDLTGHITANSELSNHISSMSASNKAMYSQLRKVTDVSNSKLTIGQALTLFSVKTPDEIAKLVENGLA